MADEIKNLRPHQVECVNAILNSDEKVGQIILSTGAGKSVAMNDVIGKLIDMDSQNKITGIHVIFSPIIMLSWQHMNNTARQLLTPGRKVDFLNVSSGKYNDRNNSIQKKLYKNGIYNSGIKTTTSVDEIKKQMSDSKNSGHHLVIMSTYHSANRVAKAAAENNYNITTYNFDEAHNAVSSNGDESTFSKTVEYRSNRKYFYTATPKTTDSDNGNGMNNKDRFGPVLYTKSPKSLIEDGEILEPALLYVESKPFRSILENDTSEHPEMIDRTDYGGTWEAVARATSSIDELLKRDSCNPEKISATVLVSCMGSLQIEGIINSSYFNQWLDCNPSTWICAMCSSFGTFIRRPNGVIKRTTRGHVGVNANNVGNDEKQDFIDALNEIKDGEKAIILHIRMITEGIDVTRINGFIPLGNLGKTPFLQGAGRSMRLHDDDRKKLYAGEMVAKDRDNKKFIKARSWIALPLFTEHGKDASNRHIEIINCMRQEYGFNSSSRIEICSKMAAKGDVNIDDGHLNRDVRGKIAEIKQIICTEEQRDMVKFMEQAKTEDEKIAMFEAIGR